MNEKQIIRILTNPFYCIEKIDDNFCIKHEPLIEEEKFIKASIHLIKEIGVEKYLKNLISNLKGEYIKSGDIYEKD